MDVTIVIPTKNAGEFFDEVLSAIERQKTSYSFEIICVDSGSKDNTVSIIKKHTAKLYQIQPNEFGHGKTRNYGASKGTGKFIVFITQDALPASENWLQNIVSVVDNNEECAGAFGVHYAYNGCNILDKRDLKNHFLRFGDKDIYFSLNSENITLYENDMGYRAYMDFYSDNNSCMRRSVWNKIPYDDVNFAEDQIWAAKILGLGYQKGYCPSAPVYHSHDYPLSTYFCRYYDEFKSLYKIQRFQLVPRAMYIPKYLIKQILVDIRFIIKNEFNLSVSENFYWIYYVIVRNFFRYVSSWIAVKYWSSPTNIQNILDKVISQQIKQIKR